MIYNSILTFLKTVKLNHTNGKIERRQHYYSTMYKIISRLDYYNVSNTILRKLYFIIIIYYVKLLNLL